MKHICFKTPLVMAALTMVSGIASAMTFSELQSAIDAASPGDTVYVTSDMEFDDALEINKTLTLASEEGNQFVLMRSAGYAKGQFLNLTTASGATKDDVVTLKNLVVDGNKDAGQISYRFADVKGRLLVLGSGAICRNFNCYYQGGIDVISNGSVVMENGSEISGFEGSQYGIVALIGNGAEADSSSFTMNGGLITGCAGHHEKSSIDWDGMLYVYGKNTHFYAYGGTIVDNTSDNCSAGVYVYRGYVHLRGDFTLKDNLGTQSGGLVFPVPASANNSDHISIEGDYTGELALKFSGSASRLVIDEGMHLNESQVIWVDAANRKYKGYENITFEDYPGLCLDFDVGLSSGWYPTIRTIKAKVLRADGMHFRNASNFEDAWWLAQPDDTIALCTNVVFTKTYWASNNVTITSAKGGPYSFERGVKNILLFRTSKAATLTLKDVVIDGCNIANENSWGLIGAFDGGTLVLDSGATIRNALTPTYGAAVIVSDSGSKLIMKDGALVANCRATNANPYGSTIMVGNGAAEEVPASFEMQGGVITGCSCDIASTTSIAGGYSGVVYVFKNNVFTMSGGAITNNSSANGCAVQNYQGTVRLTGSAVISDNVGTYADVFNCGNYRTRYFGDFRGRVGVANVDQYVSETTKVERENPSATGAWCFYPSCLDGDYVGKCDESGAVVWSEATGSVEGVKAATMDDLRLLLPTSLDVHEGSADLTRLPILLTGDATKIGTMLTLSFDKDSRKHKPAVSLPILASGDGEIMTGDWSFVLPEGAEERWSVVTSGDKFSLAYYPPGLGITIR